MQIEVAATRRPSRPPTPANENRPSFSVETKAFFPARQQVELLKTPRTGRYGLGMAREQLQQSSTTASLMPLSGWLVALARAATPKRFVGDDMASDDVSHADDELFALMMAMAVIGLCGGLLTIQMPNGAAHDLALGLFSAALGFLVGLGLPLQLLTWGRLQRDSLANPGWRWGCPCSGAALAASVTVASLL